MSGFDLPQGWTKIYMGDVFLIERGGSPRPIQDYLTQAEDGVNWIKIGDTKGAKKYIYKTEEKILPSGVTKSRMVYEGDFILSNSMSFGRPYIMKTRGCIHDGWLVIRANKNAVNADYLFYALSSSQVYEQFTMLAKGSTVKNLNIDAVKQVSIFLPPLAEQQEIASCLDTLLAQVDTIKARLDGVPALLKRFRQSVLTAAVSGKLTEEWREKSKVNFEWANSNLGKLLIDLRYGTAKKSNYEDTDGTPILRIPNIGSSGIDDTDLKYSYLDEKEKKNLALEESDLLLIRSNGSVELVGKTIVVNKKHIGFAFAGYLIRLRVKADLLNPRFLYLTLNSPETRVFIENKARSTSGVNNINSDEIKSIKIELPLLPEQKEIVSRVETIFAFADQIEARVKAAQTQVNQLTQSILAKAFRGELTAEWREQHPELISGENSAEALLARIQAERGSEQKSAKKPAKGRKKQQAEPEDPVLDDVPSGQLSLPGMILPEIQEANR